VLAEVRGFETLRRRLDGFDLDVLPELERRGLPTVLGARGLADLLQGMLRLSPGASKRRVEAVGAFGTRTAVSGAVLVPQLPVTAGAVRAGSICSEHVASMIKTLDDLPSTLPVDKVPDAEQILVKAATQLTPKDLTNVGCSWSTRSTRTVRNRTRPSSAGTAASRSPSGATVGWRESSGSRPGPGRNCLDV
jgi:hypothetical protein